MIKAERAMIALIDVQERLVPAMAAAEAMLDTAETLLTAAAALSVPVLVSRQYPKGLGDTVARLAPHLTDARTIDKMHFSCTLDDRWTAAHHDLNRPQAILIGIEAHVCVLQTVLGLQARGVETYVVIDGVTSRQGASVDHAIARMRQNNIQIVTAEMVLFEWLQSAENPAFKTISGLIK